MEYRFDLIYKTMGVVSNICEERMRSKYAPQMAFSSIASSATETLPAMELELPTDVTPL